MHTTWAYNIHSYIPIPVYVASCTYMTTLLKKSGEFTMNEQD